jgi:hypothetical protein
VHIVLNRAPRHRFRRSELEFELCRTFTPAGVWCIPADRRVDDAVWRGALVPRGPFTAATARLACAADVAPAPAPRRGRGSRSERRAA